MGENEVISNRHTMFGTGQRDYAVDMMRCISCFMVVATHVCAWLMCSFPYDDTQAISTTWMCLAMSKCSTVSATNLFLMISGIFFLSPERNVSISKIWSKNILKLACAYIVWSFIYALQRVYFLYPRPFEWVDYLKEVIAQEFHLWYIPMMLGIYILVPLMRVFTQTAERKHYLYMIALMIGAMTICTFYLFNQEYAYPHSGAINIVLSKIPYLTICQYPFYCILGYYLYTYRPKLKTRIVIYILGILGLLLTFWFTLIMYKHSGNPNPDVLQEKFTIGILAKNTALFVFVITVFSKVEFRGFARKFLSKLSAATLFIYLSHILIFYFLFYNKQWLLADKVTYSDAVIYVVVIYFSAFVFSYLFLQLIPWVRMRNAVLDTIWPNRKIWNGGKKKKK